MVNGDDTYAVRIYNEVPRQQAHGVEVQPHRAAEISAAGRGVLAGTGSRRRSRRRRATSRSSPPLVGPHNLENILAAAGMALGAGFSRRDVQDGIERVDARARPAWSGSRRKGVRAPLVDYAHTDDALEALAGVGPRAGSAAG